MKELPKVYNPKATEKKWYDYWLKKGYFHAQIPDKTSDFRLQTSENKKVNTKKSTNHEPPACRQARRTTNHKPFTIVIPPPNITGSLHMGHALNNTLQDIIIRKKRMEGYVTLWLPGTDHAGIATQNVVEQELAREGKTRYDIGRKKFVTKVWRWKEKYGNEIISQLKRLGCSCDWERLRFTMDEGYSQAFKEVFVRLYNEGLIYRGNYIINCCPRCLTALSDIEVEHDTVSGKLWYIKYPLKENNGYMKVATTRPETMLGDTAVAVNPNDKRYKKLIGKKVILPLLNREIKIIADELVDPEFGTGAVKVTPAHDPNDFEISKRHNLEKINIFTDEAVVNENGGPYKGMDRFEARKRVVKDLEKQGLLEKVEEHEHAVGHCYRCETVIEPRLSLQWFVKMKPLAQPAIKVVEDGAVKFVPERWMKIYFEWMDNIRDWCISRQIWWGHRLPVWYCVDCGDILVSTKIPKICPICKSGNLEQEDDVLDTWFSSALWPFATLGWPIKTDELEYFYPTSVLSTSFDILYFWVARMIISGLHFMGDIPFQTVYIHALIRDAEGRKMSKSRGNVIDPINDIEKFGADALRFTLASLAVPGRDVFLSEERVEGSRNFANKIWNAARFVLSNIKKDEVLGIDKKELELPDKWILSKLNKLIKQTNENIEKYDFSKAGKALYDFFWSDFADWYVEIAKERIYKQKTSTTTKAILVKVLNVFCRLAHPIMPFITEEIWQSLPETNQSIVISEYPKVQEELIDEKIEKEMEIFKDTVTAVRTMRSELRISPSVKTEPKIKTVRKLDEKILIENKKYFDVLTKSISDIGSKIKRPSYSAVTTTGTITVYLPIEGMVEVKTEMKRAKKQLLSVEEDLDAVRKKLADKQFLEKAPGVIVAKQKKRDKNLSERKEKLEEQLKMLKEIK